MKDLKDVQSNIRIFRTSAQLLALTFDLRKSEAEKDIVEGAETSEDAVANYYYYG